ncbi:MAG: TlyA family RNA methyltransferase [Actinomycetes bacterium]
MARGLARSRSHAARLVDSGLVRLNGQTMRKAAAAVRPSDSLVTDADPYVSRAAHKLIGALDDLDLAVGGRALDAGASTGGFTQVLLERGCARVFAVDVGTGQLDPDLRADPRVVVREQTNLRHLDLTVLEGRPVDLVVADVSFVSLRLLVEPLVRVTRPDGWLLLLVKPQFEVGRERLGKGGIVVDPTLRSAAVAGVAVEAERLGWEAAARVPSRLAGAGGNQETFVLLRPAGEASGSPVREGRGRRVGQPYAVAGEARVQRSPAPGGGADPHGSAGRDQGGHPAG